MKSQKNQQTSSGAILLITLILLAVVTTIAVEMYVISQNMIQREYLALELSRLRILAADAVWQNLQKLENDENLLYDYTNEAWAQSCSNTLSDGTKIVTSIIDENRFFDANNLATRQEFKAFRKPVDVMIDILTMNAFNNAIELSQAIQDWVDADLEGVREASFYLQKHTNAVPPNAPMESTREATFVFETLSTPFIQLPDGLTLLPKEDLKCTKVNINTAPEKVLLAVLGIYSSDLVVNICRRREGAPFISLSSVIPAKIIDEATIYLDVKSEYFSIFSQAEKEKKIARIYALAHRKPDGTITILRWIER
jgi:type II secretory pathway component PulK